jgi:23S rRNA (uracil1939-C5)-methyltransferase
MTLVGPQPDRAILDLFCGSGNLSLPAARHGALVTGVDSVSEAIEAARRNADRLGLRNTTQFIAMNAADTANFLSRAAYRADAVILDPPRIGARELITPLVRLRPPRIVYVSCNVATLARDLVEIAKAGYIPKRLRAFDFFPNTHHVEVIAEMLLT